MASVMTCCHAYIYCVFMSYSHAWSTASSSGVHTWVYVGRYSLHDCKSESCWCWFYAYAGYFGYQHSRSGQKSSAAQLEDLDTKIKVCLICFLLWAAVIVMLALFWDMTLKDGRRNWCSSLCTWQSSQKTTASRRGTWPCKQQCACKLAEACISMLVCAGSEDTLSICHTPKAAQGKARATKEAESIGGAATGMLPDCAWHCFAAQSQIVHL